MVAEAEAAAAASEPCKGGGHFLVNPVKVCVIRPKNSSRTIRCSIYLYSLLNRTIGNFFFFLITVPGISLKNKKFLSNALFGSN